MRQVIGKIATTTYQEIVCSVPDGLEIIREHGECFIRDPTCGPGIEVRLSIATALKYGLIIAETVVVPK